MENEDFELLLKALGQKGRLLIIVLFVE